MSTDNYAYLVSLVSFIMSAEGTEEEQAAALSELERLVPHPRVSDLIYWPRYEGFDRDLTAEEVVEIALGYRPIAL